MNDHLRLLRNLADSALSEDASDFTQHEEHLIRHATTALNTALSMRDTRDIPVFGPPADLPELAVNAPCEECWDDDDAKPGSVDRYLERLRHCTHSATQRHGGWIA